MIKFTSNNDFDFQIESVQLLRDNKSLTKRASAKELLKVSKTHGQEDLHIIALGAYEGTGLNRNGDGFKEADCKSNHHYFTKAGRAVHRHHKNKPDSPKFGNIKAAAYNDAMKRIELVVGLDTDKCADILDEQEKTGNTNWSMASKQAYDICTWCNHKAKTDKDRCEHIPSQLGEMNKEGEMCGMMNPDPRWFEISYVRRPADRIGMSLGKVASDSNAIRPMLPRDFLNIYGDIYVPDEIYLSKKASDKRVLLKKLAELEKHVEGIAQGKTHTAKDSFVKQHGAKVSGGEQIDPQSMDKLRSMDPAHVLKALADVGIIFTPEDFARYLFDNRANQQNVQGMKTHLPGIYGQADQSNDGEITNNERFEPGSAHGQSPHGLKPLAQKMHGEHSLHGGPSLERAMHSEAPPLSPHSEDKQTKTGVDRELAKQYAAYKLAALNYMDEQGKLDDELLLNAVLQNRS